MKINADAAAQHVQRTLESMKNQVKEAPEKATASGAALSERIKELNKELPQAQTDRFSPSAEPRQEASTQGYAHLARARFQAEEDAESPAAEAAEGAESSEATAGGLADAQAAVRTYEQVRDQVLGAPAAALKTHGKLSAQSLLDMLG